MQDGTVIAEAIPSADWRARTDGGESAGPRADHELAFAALVERQSRFAFRVAYAILRNVHDAEDVSQETFLKLYRTGAWLKMEDERAFLARAVWRAAVGRLPKRRSEPPDANAPTHEADPEEQAAASERLATVHRYIDSLPEELRQALALSTVEELNSRQIAHVMGLPEGTVRTRLMRAREILREKLRRSQGGRS